MRKKGWMAATVIAAAMVLVAGGLMASNMGFKLNYQLCDTVGGGGCGGTSGGLGFQTISLPYNRQVGIDNASDLMGDMFLAAGGSPQELQKYLPNTNSFLTYNLSTPAGGPNDFALQQGVGSFAKAGADFNYIVVGSHDPAAVIQLKDANPVSESLLGFNLFAPPYHTTAADAIELFGEIGYVNVQEIQKYLPTTNSFQIYSLSTPNNFTIQPGVAYFLKMSQDLAYQPSHY